MYDQSVGRNCNLILGEVVTPEDLVPESDIERLAACGRELQRRFSKPVASTSGQGEVIELSLAQPASIDQVEIMEDIRERERIREFQCEGQTGADQWQVLATGASVGHKRLAQFTPVEVSSVRLRTTRSVASPRIRRFAVYATA